MKNIEENVKKVLYITNKEVPYKVKFFNELAKKVDVTVIFESNKSGNRNSKWAKGIKNKFKYYYIDSTIFGKIFPIFKMLKIMFNRYDYIVFGCIKDKKQIFLMTLMRIFKKKYILNLDGEIFITDNTVRNKLKKFFIRGADKYLIAGEKSAEEIRKIVKKEVIPYYFTSLSLSEIEKNSKIGKKSNREDYILVIGQYFDYKGLDVAVKAAKNLKQFHFKFVGMGYRTEEFKEFVEKLEVNNIEIIPFLQENELFEEYKKCKMLVLPSKKECWGLVINEAASFGTPIVSTYGSGAAIEFLIDKYSCFLAKPNNTKDLQDKILKLYEYDHKEEYIEYLLEKSINYTIERIVQIHVDFFNK